MKKELFYYIILNNKSEKQHLNNYYKIIFRNLNLQALMRMIFINLLRFGYPNTQL